MAATSSECDTTIAQPGIGKLLFPVCETKLATDKLHSKQVSHTVDAIKHCRCLFSCY